MSTSTSKMTPEQIELLAMMHETQTTKVETDSARAVYVLSGGEANLTHYHPPYNPARARELQRTPSERIGHNHMLSEVTTDMNDALHNLRNRGILTGKGDVFTLTEYGRQAAWLTSLKKGYNYDNV